MNRKNILKHILVVCLTFCVHNAYSQVDSTQIADKDPFSVNFSFQGEGLLSTKNDLSKGKTFADYYLKGVVRNSKFEFGIQLEDLLRPMPMHRPNEYGRGLTRLYGTMRTSFADFTLGDFYEQFGSGALLRSYEERSLGIDNAIRGAKFGFHYSGADLTILAGQMRDHFDRGVKVFHPDRGFLYGANFNLSLDNLIKPMRENGYSLSIGSGVVVKRMKDVTPTYEGSGLERQRLNLPKNVPAFGGRFNFQKGAFSLFGEYDYKINDPMYLNNYTYGIGQVGILMGSFSMPGFSALLGVKRSENFDSRADRSAQNADLTVSYTPAFTQQETYALAALHPYATKPEGEFALQGELHYNLKRKTPLGGRYGTHLDFTASHVRGLLLKKNSPMEQVRGTNGPQYEFFKTGKMYYQDLNFHLYKKVSPNFSFNFSYLYQIYNQSIIEGHAYEGAEPNYQGDYLIYSNIFIYDGKYKLSNKLTLRTELQYLHSRQAEGDWLFGLAELSIVPHFMITLSDQWNPKMKNRGTDEHYYMGALTYEAENCRLQLSYGRTRAGINCTGGVCRLIPEMKGVMLSVNYMF